MGAQADPEVYHWSSRSVTGSAERRETSCCHRVASRTLFDNRVLSCKLARSHPGTYSGEMRISRIQALSALRTLIFVPVIPTQERQGSFGQVSLHQTLSPLTSRVTTPRSPPQKHPA